MHSRFFAICSCELYDLTSTHKTRRALTGCPGRKEGPPGAKPAPDGGGPTTKARIVRTVVPNSHRAPISTRGVGLWGQGHPAGDVGMGAFTRAHLSSPL